MSDAAVTAFTSLEPGQTIGPSHHRFKLINAGPSQPPGQLWSAQDVTTTTPVDVSLLIFDPRQFSDTSLLERMQTTLNRTRSLKSPHLMPFFGHYFFRGMLFISMPPLQAVNLAQLINSGRLSKLSERQRIGMLTQLGKALHAIQMGRMNHGTLCPELIWLVPGRGVQLMGTGWYNALDSETAELSYGSYQPEDHLIRGIGSTSGDAFALARLCVQLFNRGKLDNEHRPSMLDDSQWHKLSELLTNRTEAEIQAPLQLVRELFGDQLEQPTEVDTDALNTEISEQQPSPPEKSTNPSTETVKPPAAELTQPSSEQSSSTAKQTSSELAAPNAAVTSPSTKNLPAEGQPARGNAKRSFWPDLSAMFNRPVWLISGFLAGIMVSQIFNLVLREEPVPEPVNSASDVRDAVEAATALVTTADSQTDAINPFRPENIELMAKNHLAIFQHPTPEGVSAPKMVSLPKGRFLMGDIQGVGDDNEKPVRQVVVDRRFALSRFEVTFAEYDQFANATDRALPEDGGWGRGQRPVINVSWEDAQAYAQWLALQTGQPYRLPSEAEWEYAARAGTESAFWWGDALQPGMAQCDNCNAAAPRQTVEVGQYPPNPWGLYDLNGNVDEWVADCYSDNYMGATTTQQARTSSGCDQRVMRGGSWFDIDRLVRSSARYRHPPTARRDSWGFRVAVDLN